MKNNKRSRWLTGGIVYVLFLFVIALFSSSATTGQYNQYGEYTLYPVQNGNLTLERASDSEAF